jgi:hypothetical protein
MGGLGQRNTTVARAVVIRVKQWVASVLGDRIPIVLLHNVLRGLQLPSQFHGDDMSVVYLPIF